MRPQFAEAQASRAGITRPDLAEVIATTVEGRQVGVYRDNDELRPIISRAPAAERVTIMIGLGFATLLTLIVVPVLYATFFKVPYEKAA